MSVRPALASHESKLLVVGGQCRKVGKTALCVDLLRLMDAAAWTAVKVTPYTECGCPVRGASCGCPAWEHTFSIREETNRSSGKDTSRYLKAGAKSAYWVQTKAGRLADALEGLRVLIKGAHGVLIESDTITSFWRPDLFLLVADPRKGDFKTSARVRLTSADLILLRAPLGGGVLSSPILSQLASMPHLLQPFGYPLPAFMQKLVRQLFELPGHQSTWHSTQPALVVDP